MKGSAALLSALAASAQAGTVLWSGNFDYYGSSSDFDTWSWSNEVGEYQWYIHGTEPTSDYLDVSPSYHNPGVTGESNGLKLTIDSTSTWNSAYWRSELIPQTSNNLGTGQTYYHFSVKREATNPPQFSYEHQVVFFESHFTELKVGISPNQTELQWCIQSSPKYALPFTPGVWYNFAYDIDFSASTVGLWASQGSDPLVRVYPQTSASTSTNSEDWHLGLLAMNAGSGKEDWYFSGVYVEADTLTTNLQAGPCTGGDCGTVSTPSTTSSSTTATTSSTSTKPSSTSTTSTKSSSTSSVKSTSTSSVKSSSTSSKSSSTTSSTKTSTTSTTTTTTGGATASHWAQCGGQGYSGPTVCASPYTCTYNNAYYSQCL